MMVKWLPSDSRTPRPRSRYDYTLMEDQDDSNSDKELTQLAHPPPRQASRRTTNIATKSWLVISVFGEARVEEAGKHHIRRRTGIPGRDLRILDPALSYPSSVLGRERAIVVNLENIKAIITASEMLLLNPRDPSLSPFVSDLEHKLCYLDNSNLRSNGNEGTDQKSMEDSPAFLSKNGGTSKVLPFEFRVLEICLKFVCKCLESEASTLEQEAYPALDELSVSVSTLNLQRVRIIKSRLVALSARVQKVRDELEHLLDDDMDMAEMYLTDKHNKQHAEEPEPKDDTEDDSDEDGGSSRSSSADLSGQKPKVEELEMLLEAYFAQLEGALSKLSTMREYVDDTEDYINIILDEKQNQLLRIGVVMSTAIMLLNIGIVIAGIYGMNIRIPLFDYGVPMQFNMTTFGVIAGIVVSFSVAVLSIKKKGLLG
ncbi:magnesium transporter MRS2-F-like isoform X1 [Rhododendron vialii]|uniref:magnesium transporter MRS2-F-like isoform X1 n=1 Tax=Rhododendron vialii TaxID=182163 RepID=UPI00265E0CDF|nr:magnesium transporter MRS2-F-like isoform X1 [Rhododendron vialii]